MATVYDVWGFGKIIAAGPEVGANYIGRVQEAMNAGATDRGIAAHVPSDQLDMSRDLILEEFLGGDWLIDSGTLYVSYIPGVTAAQVRDRDPSPFL